MTIGGIRVRLKWASWLLCVAALLVTSTAAAQSDLLTPTGGRGQLAFDNITGLRISAAGGLQYAGPLGIATQRYSVADYGGRGDTIYHLTTFWIAPAADYFVIDQLSVGGMIELASTSGSVDIPLSPTADQNFDLPSTTHFSLLPRVGYMIPIGDRFGIWPRGGIGYVSRQVVTNPGNNASRDTFSALSFFANCGFIYRMNETFFIDAAPEIAFSLGGSHSSTNPAGASVSADAGFFQFGIFTGLGILLDL